MSRVILNALGVEDYGIYTAVGGVVTMFSMVSSALSAAISRFITFELGVGNLKRLNRVFSTSINIQIGLCFIILLIAEPIGTWFVNTQMVIPDGRMGAANWVYQSSLAVFCITLISVPYNSAIIAHETMSAFAYISILEAILKLTIAFAILFTGYDKLIAYAILLVVAQIVVRIIYGMYCRRKFEECKYHFIWDKSILKEMTGFAGWSFLTNTAYIFNTQGVNILINLFFGVTVNAARGIATQVDGAVLQFVNNFTMAINPQITKSYANKDIHEMTRLVCMGSKMTTYLLLFFSLPLIMETDYLLTIWLKNVPDYTVILVRLSIIAALIDKVGMLCSTAVSATGDIRKYVIWVSLIGSLVFPLTWICFALGAEPQSTYIVFAFVYMLTDVVRLVMMKSYFGFSIRMYAKDVVMPIVLVIVLSSILPTLCMSLMEQSFARLIFICIVCTLSAASTVYSVGLNRNERESLKRMIVSKMKLHHE